MFPLTIIPPHYIEGWIVTSMDKKYPLVSLKTLKNYQIMLVLEHIRLLNNKH